MQLINGTDAVTAGGGGGGADCLGDRYCGGGGTTEKFTFPNGVIQRIQI